MRLGGLCVAHHCITAYSAAFSHIEIHSLGRGKEHAHLLVTVGHIPNLVPWKGDFRGQPVFWVIYVEPQSINPQQ